MLQEFKKFVLRGNVVDLAVAVVIGAAFSGLVSAFVSDFITPLMGAFQGIADFSKYAPTLGGIRFPIGHFLNTLLTFIITASVVFFLVVQPLNHLMELTRRKQPTADPTTKKCPECLSEVPVMAKRCMYCTSQLKPQAAKVI